MNKPKTRLIPVVQTRIQRIGSIRYAERSISSPAEAVTLCQELIAEQIEDADREYFVVIFLNAKLRPVGFHVASIGLVDATLVHPREVFVNAILLNARSIVVAHNHPSGSTKPSREDIKVSRQLVEAGKIIGIEVMDSLVIGYHSYTSLRSQGALED